MNFFRNFIILILLSVTAQAQTQANAIRCLQKAYPILKIGSDQNSVVFPDGEKFIFDDGSAVSLPIDFDQLFKNPTSLFQMFLIPYEKFAFHTPHFDEDPGRIRHERFFRKLYGNSPNEVQKDLVQIRWLVDNSTQLFQNKYGAAQALQLVSYDLSELVKVRPEFKKYIQSPLGGTYTWRVIDGTQNLSTHSFGIAIDINTHDSNYWRWDYPNQTSPQGYHNKIPLEIVSIFEMHGFIWGGKWFHYDTMHFEYRPELTGSTPDCSSLSW